MIVRGQDDGSLILINQTDHAKLSGFLAAHWGNDDFAAPTPRESVIRAAMFHDNGWLRYETAPLYDAVRRTSPSYFQVPISEVQLTAFGQAIDWLGEFDPYAGLLISRHRTGLYRNRYDGVALPASATRTRNDERLDSFVARYEAKQHVALEGVDRAQFLVNYQLLQFWDLFSLALCTRPRQEETLSFVPTDYAGDGRSGVRMTMQPLAGTDIAIDPYPFDAAPLSFGYTYKHLPTADYVDEAAFRIAYFGAPLLLASFRFVPSPHR